LANKQELLKKSSSSQSAQNKQIVIDAANCISGRICSHVSKLLLQGNRVTIINAEKAMLSGHRYKTIQLYKEHLEINSVTNPIHGPFHPRRPDTILTKMVRGMIPKRKSSGIEAFKRLRVYIGIPESLKNSEIKYYDDSKITKPSSYYITVGEVAKEIGWSGGVEPIDE
jgi:large subunit ribosomal protein L13